MKTEYTDRLLHLLLQSKMEPVKPEHIIKYDPWLYNSLKKKIMAWGKFCTLSLNNRPQEILNECLIINKKVGYKMYPDQADEVEYVCRYIDSIPIIRRMEGTEVMIDYLWNRK